MTSRRLLLALYLLPLALPAAAQCSLQALGTAPAVGTGDQFGSAFAVQRDELFVGAPGRPYVSQPWGSVHVFRETAGTWLPVQVLEPPDLADGYGFGVALDVEGDVLAIGADAAWVGAVLQGAVYVFERQAGVWTFVQKLAASDAQMFDSFGEALDLDAQRLVIGAKEDDSPTGSGAAYVFERTPAGWVETAKLKPPGLSQFDGLGWDVAISGEWIALGKPGSNLSFGPGGRVHVYRLAPDGTWQQAQVLQGTSDEGGDFLGMNVELEGDTLVASGHLEQVETPWFTVGAVYVFGLQDGTWQLVHKLRSDDPADDWAFGAGLALDGSRMAIGSGVQSSLTAEPGGVYVYDRVDGQWVRSAAFGAPESLGQPASYGGSVGLDGARLFAGCDRDDVLGEAAGQAFAYALGELAQPFGEGLAGAGHLVPGLLGFACGTAGAGSLEVRVDVGLGGAAGGLLAGSTAATVPFAGGSLYPAPPFRVMPFVLGGAPGVPGAGGLVLAGDVPAGVSGLGFVVQALLADPGAPAGWALSRGLRVALP